MSRIYYKFIQNMTLMAWKIFVLIQKCILCIHFKVCPRKETVLFGHNMVTSATQPGNNMILSCPVQKHDSSPKLKDSKAWCLSIVVNLSIVDSHISMLLLVLFVSRTRKTKTRFTMATMVTATANIMIVCLIKANNQGSQRLP
jgi:hypothetical protein